MLAVLVIETNERDFEMSKNCREEFTGYGKPSSRRENEVIEEAMRLLNGLKFGCNYGDIAHGDHADVMVTVNWNPDDTLRAFITCRDDGRGPVNWKGTEVRVARADRGSEPLPEVVLLNAQGSAVISNLPPEDYRLVTSSGLDDIDAVPSGNSQDVRSPNP